MLAWLTAKTHGLDEQADALAAKINLPEGTELPEDNEDATLLRPPER